MITQNVIAGLTRNLEGRHCERSEAIYCFLPSHFRGGKGGVSPNHQITKSPNF